MGLSIPLFWKMIRTKSHDTSSYMVTQSPYWVNKASRNASSCCKLMQQDAQQEMAISAMSNEEPGKWLIAADDQYSTYLIRI